MFVRHPGVYLPYLRARAALGRREAAGVRTLLKRAGIVPPARVLDIACGLGRHVVPLGRAGFQVVGADLSPVFLAEARRAARKNGLCPPAVRFYRADYGDVARVLRVARERPFDAVLCLFTSTGFGTRREDDRVLRSLLPSTRPGGLFLYETGDRDWITRHFEPEGVSRPDRRHELHERRSYLRGRSEIHSEWTFYRRSTRRKLRREFAISIRVRLHTARSIRKLFRDAGWPVSRVYGNLAPLRRRSRSTHRLVVVARRPASRSRAPKRARPASG